MNLTNEQIEQILAGAPEGASLRHENTSRNRALNAAVCKLSDIVNHHDPEVDVPIASGVWDCLDETTALIEAVLHKEILQLRQQVERLEGERVNAVKLLDAALCPCCDKSGAYYDNHGEVCQCQWCDEVNQLRKDN